METTRVNLLKNEKSPYLLQHKDNPIAWMPWGEEAFRLARVENKPIFLSVGYSTCHWCHVMAHESFEDQEVAQVLNDNFISIKVDREEHPDVDQIYMSALQALSGGGGWPMSMWLTAEGKPFFAGTYFPKFRFLQLLRRVHDVWTSDPDRLIADSERLMESVKAMDKAEPMEASESEYEEFLKAYITHFQRHFDEHNGGFGGAPKFPQTMNLMTMMRQDYSTKLNQAEAIVNTTLLKMVRGGVYDQLQGGFHRYSVDEEWLVPHFEKMLYDQALLTVTLTEAYQMYGEQELARAARETLDYVLREMTHPLGGFYSAQDADSLDPEKSEKEEGYFCTYSFAEMRSFLTNEELSQIEKVYGVTPQGNFEGRNILHLQDGFEGTVKAEPIVASALEKLRKLRAVKPPPHLDDKIIASWNGWMIWAFVKAGVAFSEPLYLEAARKALGFMREEMWEAGSLKRFWRDGEAKGHGAAEDYTSLIHACLELYQADFDEQWAEWAMELQKVLDTQFWDVDDGLYFANDGRETLLPMRPKDQYDGVHPCSNSMGAYNLARLFLLTGEGKYNHQFERIASSLFAKLGQYPSSLAFMALALDFHLANAKVAVLNGAGWVHDLFQEQRTRFLPHWLWARADTKWPVTLSKTAQTPSIYICERGQCLRPATTREEALTSFKS